MQVFSTRSSYIGATRQPGKSSGKPKKEKTKDLTLRTTPPPIKKYRIKRFFFSYLYFVFFWGVGKSCVWLLVFLFPKSEVRAKKTVLCLILFNRSTFYSIVFNNSCFCISHTCTALVGGWIKTDEPKKKVNDPIRPKIGVTHKIQFWLETDFLFFLRHCFS